MCLNFDASVQFEFAAYLSDSLHVDRDHAGSEKGCPSPVACLFRKRKNAAGSTFELITSGLLWTKLSVWSNSPKYQRSEKEAAAR